MRPHTLDNWVCGNTSPRRHDPGKTDSAILPNFYRFSSRQLVSQGTSRTLTHYLAYRPVEERYFSEVAVRVPGGVRYAVRQWIRRPNPRDLTLHALQKGLFSPRPYQLAQAGDPSTYPCVFALYLDFCLHARLNELSLIRQAYPGRGYETEWTASTCLELRTLAAWQGTTLPPHWDSFAVLGLAESLHEVHAHSLADLIVSLTLSPKTHERPK